MRCPSIEIRSKTPNSRALTHLLDCNIKAKSVNLSHQVRAFPLEKPQTNTLRLSAWVFSNTTHTRQVTTRTAS